MIASGGLTSTDVAELIAVLLLTAAAAFLAASETSLTRISRIRAQFLAEEERPGSRALAALVADTPRFLSLILLLTLVAQFTATALFSSVIQRFVPGGWGVAIAVGGITLLTFIFAEVAPKTYAVQHPDGVALRVAPVIYVVGRLPILWPLTRLLILAGNAVTPGKGLRSGPFVSEEELRALVDEAEKEDVIEEEEREMLHSVFEFGDTVVREVMVPRPDMVTIEVSRPLPAVLDVMLDSGFSRIPVYEGDLDHIRGLAYAKDVLRKLHDGQSGVPLASILRPTLEIPESRRAADVLRVMQQRKSHMAIVVDEYGGTAGLVTIEDLVEEIVGEIVDEYDVEEPSVEPLPDGGWRVNARMPIDEVNELLDTDLPSTEWDSIGGLLFNLVGEIPTEGQEVEFQGLVLRAEQVKGRRIGKIVIHRAARDDAPVPADRS